MIPKDTLAYPQTYKLKFTATNPANSSQVTTVWSDVSVKSSNLTVFIDGGNRAISTDANYTLIANVEPKSENLVYKWGCQNDFGGY